MTCNGCCEHLEEVLSKLKGVTKATVNLEKADDAIEMESHIPLENFQEVLKNDAGRYSILKSGKHHHSKIEKEEEPKVKSTGTYYCPMHCDGSGSEEAGKCSVCGMDYVKNEEYKGGGHKHDSHAGHNH